MSDTYCCQKACIIICRASRSWLCSHMWPSDGPCSWHWPTGTGGSRRAYCTPLYKVIVANRLWPSGARKSTQHHSEACNASGDPAGDKNGGQANTMLLACPPRADPTGFEPAVSGVTGRRVGPLHYGSPPCKMPMKVHPARQGRWYHRAIGAVNCQRRRDRQARPQPGTQRWGRARDRRRCAG